jgi:hypothetical protein
VEFRLPGVGILAARCADSLLQKVLVKADADQLHVPRLLLAEQFARPAQIEIAGADREAGAELVQRFQRAQALQRRRRDLGLRLGGEHQIARTLPRPTRPRSWWSWARPNRSARQTSMVLHGVCRARLR